MGIERFFSFINQNFSKLIEKELPTDNNREIVDDLSIDVNSFLHPICQAFFLYNLERELTAEDERILQKIKSMTNGEKIKIIKDSLGRYIYYAYKHVNPQNILMLAVDGVAPKAKMNQQRIRRVSSEKANSDLFESIYISPGTTFMDEIDNYIRSGFVVEYGNKISQSVKIVYSGHRDYGEGEHKIFDQMKIENPDGRGLDYNKRQNRHKTKFKVILGEDSDLSVISMLQEYKIIWMRGNFRRGNGYSPLELAVRNLDSTEIWKDLFKDNFQYIKIDLLVNAITNKYLKPFGISEFVAMVTMIGNDFIPGIPELDAISYSGPDYVTMDDIVNNRRDYRFTKNSKEPVSQAKEFKEKFNKLAIKWVLQDGKLRRNTPGIWNLKSERFEAFPYVSDRQSSIRQRVRYFTVDGNDSYVTRSKDVGTLVKMLNLFRDFRHEVKQNRAGMYDNFMIESNRLINFSNLYLFMDRLYVNSESFLQSHASKNEFLAKKDLLPSRIVECSIGTKGTSKKHVKNAFVPASFTHLNEVHNFGIYDGEHTDPSLRKINRDSMCESWLEGLQYTFLYYKDGMRSIDVRWEYLYFGAPSLKDVRDYLFDRMKSIVPAKIYITPPSFGTQVEVETMDLVDQKGVKIGEMDLFEGTDRKHLYIEALVGGSKIIDLDEVQLHQYGFIKNKNITRPMLYFMNSRKNFYKIKRTFSGSKRILDAVTNKRIPYPTLTEMAFCIFPERVLRLAFSSDLVNTVLNQIGDCFPQHFEAKIDGNLHGDKAKMVYPDLARVSRVIKSLPEKFNFEIGAYDRRRDRYILFRTQGRKSGEDIIRIAKDKEAYNYPTTVKQSLKKDQGNENNLSDPDIGGWGDYLGQPRPEYLAAYNAIMSKPKAYKKIELEKPASTKSKAIGLQEFYNPLFMTEKEKELGQKFQTNSVPLPLDVNKDTILSWDYSSISDRIPLNYRFELPANRHYIQSKFRSQFIQDFKFISKHKKEADYIIYFGYDAISIYALLSLFPYHNFIFVGDSKLKMIPKYSGEHNLVVYLNKNFREIDVAKPFVEGGQKCLVISHRNTQDFNKKMVLTFKPVASLVYFNPEKMAQKENFSSIEYLKGRIRMPVYGDYKSRDSYLEILESDNLENDKYVIGSYKNRLYLYNALLRGWGVINNFFNYSQEEISGFISNVEQSTEILAWASYFELKLDDQNSYNTNRSYIMSMMNLLSSYCKQSLNFEPAPEKFLYGPMELPFKPLDPKAEKRIKVRLEEESKKFDYNLVPANEYYDPDDPALLNIKTNRYLSNAFELVRMISKKGLKVKTVLIYVKDRGDDYKSFVEGLFSGVSVILIERISEFIKYKIKNVIIFVDLYPSEEEAKAMEFNKLDEILTQANKDYAKILLDSKPTIASIVFRPVGSEDYGYIDGHLHFGVSISPYNHFGYLEVEMERDFLYNLSAYKSKTYNRTVHQNKAYYFSIKNRAAEGFDQREKNKISKQYFLLFREEEESKINEAAINKLSDFVSERFD